MLAPVRLGLKAIASFASEVRLSKDRLAVLQAVLAQSMCCTSNYSSNYNSVEKPTSKNVFQKRT